ncbi:MAG TPA: hypothetical protein VHV52_08890 [Gaiellaceae bacterium]|nr:hypothetical protein [Gaiellaceae bacterium]
MTRLRTHRRKLIQVGVMELVGLVLAGSGLIVPGAALIIAGAVYAWRFLSAGRAAAPTTPE